MYKRIFVILLSILILSSYVSAKTIAKKIISKGEIVTLYSDGSFSAEKTKTYKVGDRGPAGGWIIYVDDGSYSNDEWTYLEAAPYDLSIDWKGDPQCVYGKRDLFIFGCYFNGEKYSSIDTRTEIGTGRPNTESLVVSMKDSARIIPNYVYDSFSTDCYAASLCNRLVCNGFDDWFLPSKDELLEMYKILECEGGSNHEPYCDKTHKATSTVDSRAGFTQMNYWSSSEFDNGSAYAQWFGLGFQGCDGRNNTCCVRPIRAF